MISQRVFDFSPEDIDVVKRWIDEHIAFDGNQSVAQYDWQVDFAMDGVLRSGRDEFSRTFWAVPYGSRPPIKLSFEGDPISYIIEDIKKAGFFEGTGIGTPESEDSQEQISELPQDAWTLNFI